MSPALTRLISRLAALGLLVLLLAVLWTIFVEPTRTAFDAQEARIERSRQLLERYERAIAGEQELRAEIEALRRGDATSDRFLKGASTQIIAAELQNRIQTLVAGEPGDIRSIQVLPESEEEGFEKIGLRVTLTAGIPAMQKILYDIESSGPALFVDNLDIRTNVRRRRRNTEQTNRVQIRFDVFGFRKQASDDAT